MEPFRFSRTGDEKAAIEEAARDGSRFIAGGTNLVDLMKAGVEHPARVLDINGLPLAGIEQEAGGIRIGALARMSDVAVSPLVTAHVPVVSQALLLSASPQIRNMATVGGNLMQRTRCAYFRELTFAPCNKRNPGSGCAAMEGDNRLHAVLGASGECIATHPSDLAVALVAVDAVVTVLGPWGERKINANDFFLLPGVTPHLEHDLQPGELITSIHVPDAPHARRSAYLKVRDRSSFALALASAAAGIDVAAGVIRSARLALGGVATKPWRARLAEAALIGRGPTERLFRRAAEAEMQSARGHGANDYKIELARRLIVRVLNDLAESAA